MLRVNQILVPIDFSNASKVALDYALEMAEAVKAEVTVLHVYQVPMTAVMDAALVPNPAWITEIADAARKELDKWVADAQRETLPEVRSALVHRSPAAEINRAAEDRESDLIIMGTHGRSGLSHMLIGSVAERVVRTSPVPVLTVRESAGDGE